MAISTIRSVTCQWPRIRFVMLRAHTLQRIVFSRPHRVLGRRPTSCILWATKLVGNRRLLQGAGQPGLRSGRSRIGFVNITRPRQLTQPNSLRDRNDTAGLGQPANLPRSHRPPARMPNELYALVEHAYAFNPSICESIRRHSQRRPSHACRKAPRFIRRPVNRCLAISFA